MRNVPSEQAWYGRCGAEGDVEAAVVASCEAGFAGVADDVRFDCDGVAGPEGGYGGVDGEDDAGGFVAEDVGSGYDHGANGARVPEVDVGSAAERGRVSW